jgi:hypothetical protein
MNRAEAEQIASAITHIRPDWLRTSLITMLARHHHRPARDVALALIWVAYDPDTRGPGRIDADGPWWHTSRLAATDQDTRPPYLADTRCPKHGDREPCLPCQREAAGTPATPERIRQIREQYRATTTQDDQ